MSETSKALKIMCGEKYEPPKSTNMLSHLTNDQALKDYKYENARKLVKKQEDLLRNLAKVKQQMEFEDDQIGLTKDYYFGSRREKFSHTIGKAEKLRRQREKQNERAKEELKEYAEHTPAQPDVNVHFGEDQQGARFQAEIQRLRSQVNNIATRYKDTDGSEAPLKYQYHHEYYPGASYVSHMYPEADQVYMMGIY